MKILSPPIYDKKIGAFNVISEMTLKEYYEFIQDMISENEFQRSKVRSSKTVYSLLKRDLSIGCVIPPIVLAINGKIDKVGEELKDIETLILESKENVFILDGLQRTYIIEDIYHDQRNSLFESETLNNKIRIEFYIGLNREGILYRMLTLNTGQTPMNLRHQIEIIYADLCKVQEFADFNLIREVDPATSDAIGTYKFNDAVDAFTSYLESDYLQITREKLLSTIKTFENLSKLNDSSDLFIDLISTYTSFVKKVNEAIGSNNLLEDPSLEALPNIFGKNAVNIYNKSQPLTGFGAAISRLMDLNCYKSIKEINTHIEGVNLEVLYNGTIRMLIELSNIRITSKKIGNSQRCFFYHIFRIFFDPESTTTYLNFEETIIRAKQAYDRDN